MSVDLPAPFWPSSATISPGAIEKLDIVERPHAGEELGQVRRFENRLIVAIGRRQAPTDLRSRTCSSLEAGCQSGAAHWHAGFLSGTFL